jgi:thiol-disulfide isomerase/thioredoxin
MIVLISCSDREPENTGLEGKSLPSFKLLLTDSLTYIDTKDIPKEKPIVLLFYGPHCPYSRAEMQEIIDNMNTLKDIQFCVFTNGSFADMKEFNTHYNLYKYKNILSGLDYNNFFSEYFQITGVPYIAIYGKDSKLIKAFMGKIFSKQIKKALI